jgi:hypothetical protein
VAATQLTPTSDSSSIGTTSGSGTGDSTVTATGGTASATGSSASATTTSDSSTTASSSDATTDPAVSSTTTTTVDLSSGGARAPPLAPKAERRAGELPGADPSGHGPLTAHYDAASKRFSLFVTGTTTEATNGTTATDGGITLSSGSDNVDIHLNGASQLKLDGTNLSGYSGEIRIFGSSSDDTYIFGDGTATGDNWGKVVLEPADAGNDTLDFSKLTAAGRDAMTLSSNKSVFTSGSNTVTQGTTPADQAEEIDVTLNYAASDATSLESKVQSAFSTLATFVDSLDQSVQQLAAAIPLIDPNGDSTISKILGLVARIKALKDGASTNLTNLGSSTLKLSDVVSAINTTIAGLPAPLSATVVSTDYRGDGSNKLQVLVNLHLPATAKPRHSG